MSWGDELPAEHRLQDIFLKDFINSRGVVPGAEGGWNPEIQKSCPPPIVLRIAEKPDGSRFCAESYGQGKIDCDLGAMGFFFYDHSDHSEEDEFSQMVVGGSGGSLLESQPSGRASSSESLTARRGRCEVDCRRPRGGSREAKSTGKARIQWTLMGRGAAVAIL
jgi:hypothetical protein